jgi:hypothetical protein
MVFVSQPEFQLLKLFRTEPGRRKIPRLGRVLGKGGFGDGGEGSCAGVFVAAG